MAKKYIDADLLRKEIEFAKSVYSNPERVVHGVADAYRQDGRAAMCEDILKKLGSLQQEQPCDTCTNDKGCVTCKNGELWEGKEQPSEDLEKEIENTIDNTFCDMNGIAYLGITGYATVEDMKYIARHFYELGKQSKEPVNENLEKEECELVTADEDIITIHLGKVLTEKQYDAVLHSVIDHLNKHWWHILRWSA